MRLQNVLKHWGCWSVGDESITANLPNVRHLGATEHPFLSNARGPELAVDGNKNGFGEMYLSQTVSILSEGACIAYMESTVVDISILPPSFKPVSLFLSRIYYILKTPKQVFFNPIKYILTSFTTLYLLFYNYTFFV